MTKPQFSTTKMNTNLQNQIFQKINQASILSSPKKSNSGDGCVNTIEKISNKVHNSTRNTSKCCQPHILPIWEKRNNRKNLEGSLSGYLG